MVAAGLQRDVGGGSARRFARLAQRLDLGVVTARRLGEALSDEAPSLTMTAPTAGLGLVPSARFETSRARCMKTEGEVASGVAVSLRRFYDALTSVDAVDDLHRNHDIQLSSFDWRRGVHCSGRGADASVKPASNLPP